MSSSCLPQKREPEVIVDIVLKRAKVGKVIGRILKTRLRLAQFKASRGWEDLSIDALEPKIDEIRRQNKLNSNNSDASCKPTFEQVNKSSCYFMSSPNEDSFIFSDHSYSENFEESCFDSYSRKRHSSSSPFGSSGESCSSNSSVQTFGNYQVPPSPPKFCRQAHFTTTSGPGLSFYAGSSSFTRHAFDYHNTISDDEEISPPNSFNISSSPPQTPRINYRARLNHNLKDRKEIFFGGDGANLPIRLTYSPSSVELAQCQMPPSTPPPRNLALPASVMFTPHNDKELLPKLNDPRTPLASFDFSDYVNMTPSSVRPNIDTAPIIYQSPGATRNTDMVDF